MTKSIFRIVLMSALFAFMFWLFLVRGAEVLGRQHQAESFPATQGEVLSSQTTITHGSKGGVHYHVSISYRYMVAGQAYHGRRYRYDGHPGNWDEVDAIVAQHPPHSLVDVFYNPQNPADSVLSAGVDAQDVYLLFLTTPLCLVFLWVLLNAIQNADWGATPLAGGVKLIPEMMVTRVRLPRFQPLLPGLATLAVLSFLAGILMAGSAVSGPPLTTGGCFMAVVLLGGATAYGWQYCKIHSGRQDLVIDESARTIQLPLTYKRRAQTPIAFAKINAVALKKVRHQNKGGVFYTYLVVLKMKDGPAQNLINLNQARAEALAGWLKEKFGLTGVTPTLNPEA